MPSVGELGSHPNVRWANKKMKEKLNGHIWTKVPSGGPNRLGGAFRNSLTTHSVHLAGPGWIVLSCTLVQMWPIFTA